MWNYAFRNYESYAWYYILINLLLNYFCVKFNVYFYVCIFILFYLCFQQNFGFSCFDC